VHPAATRELDTVKDNEMVDGVKKAKISGIRKEIRLHNRDTLRLRRGRLRATAGRD
jgi:hypothetical protein